MSEVTGTRMVPRRYGAAAQNETNQEDPPNNGDLEAQNSGFSSSSESNSGSSSNPDGPPPQAPPPPPRLARRLGGNRNSRPKMHVKTCKWTSYIVLGTFIFINAIFLYVTQSVQSNAFRLTFSVYNQTLYEPDQRDPTVWVQREDVWSLPEIEQVDYQYSAWFWDFWFCGILLMNGYNAFRIISSGSRITFSFYDIILIIIAGDAIGAHVRQSIGYFALPSDSTTLLITGGFCFAFFIIEYTFFLTCIGMVYFYPFRSD